MKQVKRILSRGMVCLAIVSMLTGCGVRETLSPINKGEKEYGKAEVMVILTTEKLRYEDVYTEEIWGASVDEQGTTFEEVLLPQVRNYLIDLKTMSRMAEEWEIALTSREKDLVSEASAKYYLALGTDMAEEFGLSQGDVAELYEDYWLSEKLVSRLTGDLKLEVSDSEAKVITVAQIELSDRETAGDVLEKTLAEEADFYGIAQEHSENEEIKVQIYRGLKGDSYEEAAFELAEGDISGVISADGYYYILKCMDDYDEEATRIRKEQMMQEKKTEAFHTSYQAYKGEHPLIGDEELWDSLSVKEHPDVEADFFAIFEETCRESESRQ